MENTNKNNKSQNALREEEVLKFWKENQIFEKSVENPAGSKPRADYVFYDGPPFGTGLPHYGHLLAGTIKDAFPRYHTMRGESVRRTWGWDCHGLPVENLIEKKLGLNTKKDIEEYGVDKFNTEACNSVLEFSDDWKKIIPMTGRFVDMEQDYKTMDATYTESIWWIFSELDKKGLIYQGYKPMHLCPRCETTLSNFEVTQGYKDITDISVYVKFKIEAEENIYLLAWTTTPWTLPGNVALTVGKDITYSYIKIKDTDAGDAQFILAKDRIENVLKGKEYEIIKEVKGSDLVGVSYEAPFDYYQKDNSLENNERGWKVCAGEFVTLDAGTGIVHIAPAFGEDDMKLGQSEKLPFVQHVKTDGHFKEEVTHFAGMQVKPKDNHQATDIEIIKYLAHNHHLFEKEKIIHSYPHCWRCDTPLLNYASTSWFVETTKLKDKLIAANQEVTWIPEHVKDGRFGNWLENVRDWAISRSRYWGAPLPVWFGEESKKKYVIESVEELKKYTKKSGNKYFVMRHGEGEHNVLDMCSSNKDNPHHLTEFGIEHVKTSSEFLKDKNIDVIIRSPFVRTKETTKIICDQLDFNEDNVIEDDRIAEFNFGDFNLRPFEEYLSYRQGHEYDMDYIIPGGESLQQAKNRFAEFFYDIEKEYEGKNILVVTHGIGFQVIPSIISGAKKEESGHILRNKFKKIPDACIEEFEFVPLSHNTDYELDLHLPYIDRVELVDNGEKLVRTKEVFDCWFESGAMPYASIHYPFENKELFEKQFPADFIAEGMDQTRGWFYSLLILGVALFDKSPYKRVVVNGIILAEDGQKMSKKLKNYPDVTEVLEKYGADALRYYILSSPAVKGEELRFSEKDLAQISSRVVGRLLNVFSFYELYKKEHINLEIESTNVLDQWILARLYQLLSEIENGMEMYELDKAVRPIDLFVDDLSTWYLRRSRDRLKDGDGEAIATLYTVLKTLSQMIAPFMPFVSEYIWLGLKSENSTESVHLSAWPVKGSIDEKLIEEMVSVREIVTIGLKERQKVNIPVRQPLSKIKIKNENIKNEYQEIIKDELNIKEICIEKDVENDIELDIEITPELKKEGMYRELVRSIQDMRKEKSLNPSDIIKLSMSENAKEIVQLFLEDLQKTVGAENIVFNATEGKEVKINQEIYFINF